MVHLPLDLASARDQYQLASTQIIQEYAHRAPDHTGRATPTQLDEAIIQFLEVATRLDGEPDTVAAMQPDEVSAIGDYGLQLISDLSQWASVLDLEIPQQRLEDTALAAASWIIRHAGRIRTPEIIVDGLARLANSTEDPDELAEVTAFMTQVINALATVLREDLERSSPGRAWRVLHLNRAIVATRTFDANIMQEVFDELINVLPEEAPQFFTEGMAQMDQFDYPDHVRAIMRRYFDIWGRRIMH